MADYKNVAVVLGEGEGADRIVRIVSLGNITGEDRRELFVDAVDLKREYQVATPTGAHDGQGNPVYSYTKHTYTNTEFGALLDARGHEKLSEHLKAFTIACAITQNNIAYGVDYHLGDRVPLKLPEYGVSASARICSATRAYEADGDKAIAILDEFEMEGM
jgi:hypothetical protein